MDTSKEYISMCEKAAEIQKARSLIEDGDYYWWSVTDNVQTSFTEHHADYNVHHPEHWDWLSGRRIIWLPRQDQLQAMVGFEGLQTLTWRIHEFSETKYGGGFTIFGSMEQLWLAFVMKEKYNKVWNGTDWIKE